MEAARLQIMNWSKPKEMIRRRQVERKPFLDDAWTSDGIVTVHDVVNKPSYAPRWPSARQVDIGLLLQDVVARADQ